MRIPIGEREISSEETKYVTDSSVYLSADTSPSYTTSSATGTAYTFGGDEMEQVAYDYVGVTGVTSSTSRQVSFTKPSGIAIDDYEVSSSTSLITITGSSLSGNTLYVSFTGRGAVPATGNISVSWIAATGYFVVSSVSIPLEGVTQYGNAYSISGTPSFTVNGGNGTYSATAGSYSLSSNGQTLTVTNLRSNIVVGGSSVSTTVTVSLSVRVRHDYITGYSGTASAQVSDANPRDIAVSSVSSNVTSHSTPYLSGSYIYCTLYGNSSGTASVTFSYKVGETVTEKFFMVKHNGELVAGVKHNGEILLP